MCVGTWMPQDNSWYMLACTPAAHLLLGILPGTAPIRGRWYNGWMLAYNMYNNNTCSTQQGQHPRTHSSNATSPYNTQSLAGSTYRT
jgi:hypothetical protein